MKSQEEVLLFVLGLLSELKIPYMLVGSFASSYWGRPRTTHDADILLLWNPIHIDSFVKKLEVGFYVDKEDLKDSLKEQRMSNIIHLETGFKIDLSPIGDNDYYTQALARRKKGVIQGKTIYFASPEDVILTKLLWAKQSESQRQIEDARGILSIQKDTIDFNYLKHWAQILSTTQLLNKIL